MVLFLSLLMLNGVEASLPTNFSLEALRKRADQHVPAVDQHEQHNLEWQCHKGGRYHHHAHGHEYRRHDHIDNKERNKHRKADLEGGFQFACDKSGDEYAQWHVFRPVQLLTPESLTNSARSASRVCFIMNALRGAEASVPMPPTLLSCCWCKVRRHFCKFCRKRPHDEKSKK